MPVTEQDRLSSLEASYAHLDKKVDAGFAAIGEQLKDIARRQNDRDRTPWAVLIGAAVLILALVRFGADSYIRGIDRIDVNQSLMAAQFREHEGLDGHNVAMVRHQEHEVAIARVEGDSKERHADMVERLDRFDTALQREMRDLDARLQGEFGAQLSDLRGEVADIKREMIGLSGDRFRRSDYDKYVMPKLESLDARIRELGK